MVFCSFLRTELPGKSYFGDVHVFVIVFSLAAKEKVKFGGAEEAGFCHCVCVCASVDKDSD